MNYGAVFRLLSVILLTLAVAFLLCLAVGYPYRSLSSEQGAMAGFAISLFVALGMSLAFFIFGRESKLRLFRKEALCVVGLGWLLASLIGALPYLLILPDCKLADAIFESTSGLTTTGASVFKDLESFPRSLLFWRAISQWIGGMGIVVFFVVVLSFLGAGAKVLFFRESSTQSMDLDSHRMHTGVVRILFLYLGLSVPCVGAYQFLGMSWYDSICHMFTTVSTAGFSTKSESIAAFNSPAIEWVAIVFMSLGGTSFLVMLRLLRGKLRLVLQNTELKGYYCILIGSVLILFVIRLPELSVGDVHTVVRQSAFQAVSIMTTTGYSTADFNAWIPAAHTLLLALMFIGGSSGSTAGGFKIVRVLLIGRLCLRNIETAFRSRVVRPLKINRETVDAATSEGLVNYLVLITAMAFVSVLLVAVMEPTTSFKGTFSAAIACLFNIGPGLAEVGPASNYSPFHSHTKIFLSLTMVMGRLELYAILVLFAPSLWRKFE